MIAGFKHRAPARFMAFGTAKNSTPLHAIEFLRSNDKTCGWASLLPQIVDDMICAGPSGTYSNGFPKVNGVVIGFMQVIGAAASHSTVLDLIYNQGPD
jgi:hypothetical protein